ncbi:uncharacterized protein LOC131852353 [Achroia grisella]|uniref:uncharacterized protein LOC131852353 n=1 Tax=Achroia grisella TaxID=688607 RepID=UPI0027D257EA|nr:uncharacterized protein LOC131852353 [Achroia grisella]
MEVENRMWILRNYIVLHNWYRTNRDTTSERDHQESKMGGCAEFIIFCYLLIAVHHVTSANEKEPRKVGLLIPEKLIGGVIDIVQSHKQKPSTTGLPNQQTYPNQQIYAPQQGYQPQYANQWSQQSNYQNQFQNQYGNYQPGNGNYQPGNGNYQPGNGIYQSGNGNYQPGNGNYQPGNGNYQSGNGNYQPSPGNYVPNNYPVPIQESASRWAKSASRLAKSASRRAKSASRRAKPAVAGQNQNQSSTQFQGQTQVINQETPGSGGIQSGGLQVSGGHQSGGPGPTCICQAWTKPHASPINEQGLIKPEDKKD